MFRVSSVSSGTITVLLLLSFGVLIAYAPLEAKQAPPQSPRSPAIISPITSDIGLLPSIGGVSLDLLLLGLLGMGYGASQMRSRTHCPLDSASFQDAEKRIRFETSRPQRFPEHPPGSA